MGFDKDCFTSSVVQFFCVNSMLCVKIIKSKLKSIPLMSFLTMALNILYTYVNYLMESAKEGRKFQCILKKGSKTQASNNCDCVQASKQGPRENHQI